MNISNEDKLLNIEKILHKAGVGEGMVVADFGCGPSGHFVFPAAKMVGKNGKVYAIDVLKKNLETVQKIANLGNYQNIETIWSNIEIFNGLKLEPGSIDVVLIVNTLHQSKQSGAIMREGVRLLRKNGIMLIVDWKKVSLPFGPKPSERTDEKHVMQLTHKLGLSLEEEFNPGKYHFGLIFQKI